MSLDRAAVLGAYDVQERARLEDGGESLSAELIGGVVRKTYPGDHSMVTALGLDDDSADAAIAEQLAWFAARDDGAGRGFEWKVYGHDRPADLGRRLEQAGFVPEDEEAFVVGSTDDVLAATAGTHLPDGVRLREVDDAGLDRDVERVAALHEEVWGEAIPGYADLLRTQKRSNPHGVRIYLVETDDEQARVVCAARLEMRPAHAPGGRPGSDFAGLWGGSTVAEWRGRGIYRSLVRRRAEDAAHAGIRWLQVDASPDSRPILERLGFEVLDWTRPYIWTPPGG